MILTRETATPRCSAIVDLLSKHFRPFNFLVTVTGDWPHNFTRRYKIAAPTDDEAAVCGMQLFVRECRHRQASTRSINQGEAPLAPKAKLDDVR